MESKGEDITKDIEKMKIPNLHKLSGPLEVGGDVRPSWSSQDSEGEWEAVDRCESRETENLQTCKNSRCGSFEGFFWVWMKFWEAGMEFRAGYKVSWVKTVV